MWRLSRRPWSKPVHLLEGVTLAHCDVGRPVEVPYRELHTLPVTLPKNVTIYSGAWGKSYKPTEKLCAESITAGLVGPIDVPRVIETAYRDGVRAFIEVGPGNSCSRMISAILGERPHFARAAHAGRQDAVSQILRLIAHLVAERLTVDLASLYGIETQCVGHREPEAARQNEVVIPVGLKPVVASVFDLPRGGGRRAERSRVGAKRPPSTSKRRSLPHPPESLGDSGDSSLKGGQRQADPAFAHVVAPFIEAAANVQVLNMQAQESFLRLNSKLMESAASVLRFQTAILEAWMHSRRTLPRCTETLVSGGVGATQPARHPTPPLTRVSVQRGMVRRPVPSLTNSAARSRRARWPTRSVHYSRRWIAFPLACGCRMVRFSLWTASRSLRASRSR